jgi:dATP pyrophosphohydrolase
MPVRLALNPTGVSVIVLRGAGSQTETLLLRRAGKTLTGAWCQVAGSIEAGEKAWETALREVWEETALRPTELHAAGTCEQFYDPSVDGVYVAPVFAAFVDDAAVVTLNAEHSEHMWVRLHDVDDHLATPNQREIFAHVRRHFVERKPTKWSRVDCRSQA